MYHSSLFSYLHRHCNYRFLCKNQSKLGTGYFVFTPELHPEWEALRRLFRCTRNNT